MEYSINDANGLLFVMMILGKGKRQDGLKEALDRFKTEHRLFKKILKTERYKGKRIPKDIEILIDDFYFEYNPKGITLQRAEPMKR